MNLDKHFNMLPFNCFTVNHCKDFVKQQGYFSDDIEDFSNIVKCGHRNLSQLRNKYVRLR